MAFRIVTNMNFHVRDSAGSLLMGQIITLFYFIVVLVAFINIALHGQICNAVTEEPTTQCSDGNFTASSKFQSNLNALFDRLVQGTNHSGFNSSVYGESPNKIYGLFQCRADMTVDQCNTCWQLATLSIQQKCGNSVGATTWAFHCFLRYENYSFIGQLDTDIGSNFEEGFGGDAGVFIPDDFQSAAKNLLNNLSAKATTETKRSAYGTALDSLSQTIYALVQCTRDLNTNDCKTCLLYSINKIFNTDTTAGAQYWSKSCILRYEIYPFYNSSVQLPAAPAGGAGNSPQNKSSDHRRRYIILGVVGGLVLGLIIPLLLV